MVRIIKALTFATNFVKKEIFYLIINQFKFYFIMKKLFLAVALVAASLTVSAQIVVPANQLCNYMDIQAHATTLSAVVPTSTTPSIAPNGTKFWGYYNNTTLAESAMSWNVKTAYNTAIPMPELVGVVDTLKSGTQYRAASGGHIDLGALTMPTSGKMKVYFQPNGDSDRGVTISVKGTVVATKSGSGVKLGAIRPGYVCEYTLPAGSYAAGEIVVTAITNTSNIVGIGIENVVAASTSDAISSGLLKKVGDVLENKNNLDVTVVSLGGATFTSSESEINISALPAGVYVASTKEGSLKFVK